MSRRFFRRAWRIAGVVGIAGLTVPLSPAGAESLRYQASAGADGARLSVTIPGATVVDQVIDGGGPTAQAAVSSLGGSSALAAQPYPGELAIIGPGLGASFTWNPGNHDNMRCEYMFKYASSDSSSYKAFVPDPTKYRVCDDVD